MEKHCQSKKCIEKQIGNPWESIKFLASKQDSRSTGRHRLLEIQASGTIESSSFRARRQRRPPVNFRGILWVSTAMPRPSPLHPLLKTARQSENNICGALPTQASPCIHMELGVNPCLPGNQPAGLSSLAAQVNSQAALPSGHQLAPSASQTDTSHR